MIGISKLYCGTVEASDPMRYGRSSATLPPRLLQFSADKKPVVVWNCTQRCNLNCAHCYSSSTSEADKNELTTDEAKKLLDDLADFGCPVVLFSGGEPLMRPDLPALISHARAAGLRAAVSTNGTLISPVMVERLARADVNYVGVSLDGLADVNDAFRGRKGAFDESMAGIRNCRSASIKVGLRLTMNRGNIDQLGSIFDLIEREGIRRACFYHLVPAGRGNGLQADMLSHQQTRRALDLIMDRTAALVQADHGVEVLTVDNHADGPYVYLRLLRQDARRAENCLELLKLNGGNSSGIGIACISWDGSVHPDQFWRSRVLGNIRHKPFGEIWSDPDQPLLAKLRNRKKYLKGRCADCRWLSVCNGNLRARADSAGDPWGDDPACYLTDEEIKPQ